uniref:Cytochrome c oxidase subunit 3 n=1 Tax=Stenus clavicornis TaxID=1202167 RepID=A0A191ZRZ7_9COLE|nr:cytochrome c oxidase subunit 3 [Stenus clavicornis]
MNSFKNHPFHLVDYSPWPLISSLSTLNLMVGMIKWFHKLENNLMLLSLFINLLIMYQWWRDTIREGIFQGIHTNIVITGLQMGMILFITSEIFFFLSFFWAFFHSSLSPTIEIGMNWPPIGIMVFNPLNIPLLNTMILLSSGISITWSHHSIIENNFKETFYSLLITIILGIYFSILQGYEYLESSFSISDSIYGSCFFMATGFHGIHVIIGTTFIISILIRHFNNHFSNIQHFSFEAAAWYWHFVDVVWLFLYISIYWWGS